MKIFIVDDDNRMIRQMKTHLQDIATSIQFSNVYQEALDILLKERFDCIICDYELSFRSDAKHGIDLIQALRAKGLTTPVIVVTGKDESVIHSWDALNSGSDDFLRKPYTPQDLIARVSRVCHRFKEIPLENQNILSYEELLLNLESRRLHIGGKEVSIRKMPFLLLVKLIRNVGKTLPHSLLQEYLWGGAGDVDTEERNLNGLRVHMFNLKNTLEKHGLYYIHNVHGVGYVFGKEL